MRALRLLLLAAFVLTLAPAVSHAWEAKVLEVLDGDTLDVLKHGRKVRIRFYGIDTPEKAQDAGQEAKAYARELVEGKTVDIEVVSKGRHGRVIGLIRYDDGDKILNEEMVRAGWAWVYRSFCSRKKLCARLKAHEERAQDERIGLWKKENPMPPWEWRRIQKSVPKHAQPRAPKPKPPVPPVKPVTR